MPSNQSNGSTLEETPEQRAAGSQSSAMLLGFVGGTLDAFLYLSHGRVFAGAMTGNAVLCGIALLGRNGAGALQHALPIVAFVCGVWMAEVLAKRLKQHATTVGLGCEMFGLLAASFLPGSFPNLLFVPWIAFLAAYQIASFRKIDRYSYNSTFITGDLRTTVVGLYEALDPAKRADGLRQARSIGLVIFSFVGGAVSGSVLAPRLGNRTLWLPVATLMIVLVNALRRSWIAPGAAPAERIR